MINNETNTPPELMLVSDLTPNPQNPRQIDEQSLLNLMKDIQRDPTFMWSRPILANKMGDSLVVYAGHQRLVACMRLGIEEVPVSVTEISEQVMNSRMVLDNVHYGFFDTNKLGMFSESDLKFLDIAQEDFEMQGVFKASEVDFNPEGDDQDNQEDTDNTTVSSESFIYLLLFETEEEKLQYEMAVANLGEDFETYINKQVDK